MKLQPRKLKNKLLRMSRRIARKINRHLVKAGTVSALLLLASGCATQTPSSRAQHIQLDYCQFNIYAGAVPDGTNSVQAINSNSGIPSIELMSQAMANDGSERMSTPQTNDIRPTTAVEVPVNKSGRSQSVGSAIGDAVAGALGHLGDAGKDKPAACPDCQDCQDAQP